MVAYVTYTVVYLSFFLLTVYLGGLLTPGALKAAMLFFFSFFFSLLMNVIAMVEVPNYNLFN